MTLWEQRCILVIHKERLMIRLFILLGIAATVNCLDLQAQIRNGDFSDWVEGQEFGEIFHNPEHWVTSNYSQLGQARVSVVERVDGNNSIVDISRSTSLDAFTSGYIHQDLATDGITTISMWAKCESLDGNSGCVLAIKALDGTILQTDTTKVVDTDFRNYELIVDNQILTQHDSITVWIEAQGTIDQWDEEDDGSAVFLIDEVRATSEPLSFEFLDHRHKLTLLGASQSIDEGILYVSNNSDSSMTTINIVDANCEIRTLYESDLSVFGSSIQVLDDSTYMIALLTLIDYDFILGGMIGVIVENGEVIEVEENLNPFVSGNSELGETNRVWLDSLGKWILDTDRHGLFIYDTTLVNLGIEENLFLNEQGDWFLYTDSELYSYDGNDRNLLLENQQIRFLKRGGRYNYILSRDSLYRYDAQFSLIQDKWVLPESDLTFNRILLSDSEITFIVNKVDDFSIIKNNSGVQTDLTFPKEPTENLALLSALGDSTLMLAGRLNTEDPGIATHLFFREFSLYKEDFYSRMDVSIDNYEIKYTSTELRIDAIADDTIFWDNFKVSISVTNNQDVVTKNLGSYSKYYNSLFGPFEKYVTVHLNEEIESFGSASDCYTIDDQYGRVDGDIELYITGANYKFNKGSLEMPFLISPRKSLL